MYLKKNELSFILPSTGHRGILVPILFRKTLYQKSFYARNVCLTSVSFCNKSYIKFYNFPLTKALEIFVEDVYLQVLVINKISTTTVQEPVTSKQGEQCQFFKTPFLWKSFVASNLAIHAVYLWDIGDSLIFFKCSSHSLLGIGLHVTMETLNLSVCMLIYFNMASVFTYLAFQFWNFFLRWNLQSWWYCTIQTDCDCFRTHWPKQLTDTAQKKRTSALRCCYGDSLSLHVTTPCSLTTVFSNKCKCDHVTVYML